MIRSGHGIDMLPLTDLARLSEKTSGARTGHPIRGAQFSRTSGSSLRSGFAQHNIGLQAPRLADIGGPICPVDIVNRVSRQTARGRRPERKLSRFSQGNRLICFRGADEGEAYERHRLGIRQHSQRYDPGVAAGDYCHQL